MKLGKIFIGMCVAAVVSGCGAEPFEREALPLLKGAEPRVMVKDFAGRLLRGRLTFDDTVIVEAPFREKLALLGELVVDRPADRFDLVGLTPVGVTLFALGGDAKGTMVQFILPPLMPQKDLLVAMGVDIRRMYFDLAPETGARVASGERVVEFREKQAEGTLVYVFGGEPAVLLEKRMEGILGVRWRIRYYHYVAVAGGIYPQGIVMDNGQFHYRIVVKNRSAE